MHLHPGSLASLTILGQNSQQEHPLLCQLRNIMASTDLVLRWQPQHLLFMALLAQRSLLHNLPQPTLSARPSSLYAGYSHWLCCPLVLS